MTRKHGVQMALNRDKAVELLQHYIMLAVPGAEPQEIETLVDCLIAAAVDKKMNEAVLIELPPGAETGLVLRARIKDEEGGRR